MRSMPARIVVPVEVDGQDRRVAGKLQERDTQPSDRDRAFRRCCNLPWRCNP